MPVPQDILSRAKTNDREEDAPRILPRHTESLCPECLSVVAATLYEADERVYMRKRCPDHGTCNELISSDARFYELMAQRDLSANGLAPCPSPRTQDCPQACGLCADHLSGPMMINIDLTNRCNLHCPICFASAGARQEVVELSLDQIRRLLDLSCESSAYLAPCLQYTGGEPTVHPEFLQALREARGRNFAQIQAATNGLRFGTEPEFAAQASEAGLNVAYLQFDGFSDDVYRQTRGRPLLDIKLAAIENLYAARIRTILVPTVAKGINEDQLGRLVEFAIKNSDRICAISFQPVAFTGRLNYAERLARRFTIADLAREIERQTGLAQMYRDWYPFCFVDPFARLIEALGKTPTLSLGCSPACGAATYLIVDSQTGVTMPIPAFVDVQPLMETIYSAARRLKHAGMLGRLSATGELRHLRRFHRQEKGLAGWSFGKFVDFLLDFVEFRQRYGNNDARVATTEAMRYRSVLLAGMHFQDVYNYQLDRVRRCVIHYAAPDGRIYPFCTYNSGPCHRWRAEREVAIPLERYQRQFRGHHITG
jgi:uncharacterized radical SAM superfamily Fe-S cluster-containing enzyme